MKDFLFSGRIISNSTIFVQLKYLYIVRFFRKDLLRANPLQNSGEEFREKVKGEED
jgi:hypothetical protein